MSNTSFYSSEELKDIGLKSYGKDVLISRNVRIYSAERVTIGNNVRIDDFCILCGDIKIGSNIHIAPYCVLYGAFGIELGDYSGLSARVAIYSAIDDFSGEYVVGPMVDECCRKLESGRVYIGDYVQIGVGCNVFPNVRIAEGVAVGAMSLVKDDLDAWGIYAGVPVKRIKERSKNLLNKIK